MSLFKKKELEPADPFLAAQLTAEDDGLPLPDAITALRQRQALIRETLGAGENPLAICWTNYHDLVVVTPQRVLEVHKRSIHKELHRADLAEVQIQIGQPDGQGQHIGLVSLDTHASLRGGDDTATMFQSIQFITTPLGAQAFRDAASSLLE
jgi:hypothetical protein